MALKLIFMGTPDFAVPILDTINNSEHKILCCYTQPPKKKNRGQKKTFSPIQIFCEQKKLKLRYPDELDLKEYNFIKEIQPDVVIVVAYGKIIPKKILELKNSKFINIHASLLPKWRGAAPIQRSLINLDKETGISIMKIIPELDAGPVMMMSKIEIDDSSSFEEVSSKLSILGSEKIIEALDLIEKKKEKFIAQNEKEATYAKKIKKSEAKINWNDSAKKIIAKIKAFNPNPGSWFNLEGSRIKVLDAVEIEKRGTPGEIISNKLIIACSDKAVQITKLKKEGKRSMSIDEFLKGTKIKIGKNLIN